MNDKYCSMLCGIAGSVVCLGFGLKRATSIQTPITWKQQHENKVTMYS